MDKPPESLIVKMFAEIMPEVKFIDVTPNNDDEVADKAKKDSETKSCKSRHQTKLPKELQNKKSLDR